jgi:tripartite ATP-independent transporter DctM subunit
MEIITLVISLLLLFFLGIPVFLALGLSALFCFIVFTDIPLTNVAHVMFASVNRYSILCVLFFIYAGNIMAHGELANRLINFVKGIVGSFRGGLAMAVVGACALFGTISGSTLATLVAIGGIMYPSLVKNGYDKTFSVGLVTNASVLGHLVPPSLSMVIYALFANQSIARLFMAQYLPALLIVLAFCIYISFWAKKRKFTKSKPPNFREFFQGLREGFWALMLPVLLFVGIYSGIFTATEASAVATVYAIIAEIFIFKDLSLKDFYKITVNTGMVMEVCIIPVAAGGIFGEYLNIQQIPDKVCILATSLIHSQFMFLLMINILFLMAGCLIDMITAIVIFTPVLLPLLKIYDVSPIHFGVIFMFNMGFGFVTPPFGINLFAALKLWGLGFQNTVKGCIPFLVIAFGMILIITYCPFLSSFLVDLWFGK